MDFNFIGGAYKGRSTELNPQECVNLYPVIDIADAKHVTALFGTPGLVEYVNLPLLTGKDSGRVRALTNFKGILYAVIGNNLFKYSVGSPAHINATRTTTNLVTNGDMELDANWTDYGSINASGRTSDDKYSGTYSWGYSVLAGLSGIQSASITTAANVSYKFSAWIKINTSGPQDMVLRIIRGDGAAVIVEATLNLNGGYVWEYVSYEWTETHGGSSGSIIIMNGPSNPASVYVDDVSVVSLTSFDQLVYVANNTSHIMGIEPGSGGWTYTLASSTFAAISDGDFPTPKSLCYLDGYFIVTKIDTNLWYISATNDPTSWDALDYQAMESKPDIIIGCLALTGQVALFGNRVTEFHAHTGASDWPFSRVAVVDEGLGGERSLARYKQDIYLLTVNREVVRISNYQSQRVSTDSIEYQIGRYTTVSDAVGFIYSQEGHSFYQLSFPSEDKTWVYDITTGLWHERQSYKLSGGYGMHRANCFTVYYNYPLVGDYDNGIIYQLSMDQYTDNGNAILRRRTAPVLANEQKRIFYHSLEIDFGETTVHNNLEDHADIFSLYRMEIGNLTADSIGDAILRPTEEAPYADYLRFKEGTGSCFYDKDGANEMKHYITDSDLPAGHPFKSTATGDWTVTLWFRLDEDIDDHSYIVSKYDVAGNERTQALAVFSGTTNVLVIYHGYNSGNTGERLETDQELSINNWYFVYASYDASENLYRIRLWDSVAGEYVFDDYLDAPANALYRGTANFVIGGRSDTQVDRNFNGNLDEVAIFDAVLSDSDCDDIRDGTYGSGGPMVSLEWSDDGGQTWSSEYTRQIASPSGAKRVIWRRLGAARNRVFKMETTADNKIVIINADLSASPGRS